MINLYTARPHQVPELLVKLQQRGHILSRFDLQQLSRLIEQWAKTSILSAKSICESLVEIQRLSTQHLLGGYIDQQALAELARTASYAPDFTKLHLLIIVKSLKLFSEHRVLSTRFPLQATSLTPLFQESMLATLSLDELQEIRHILAFLHEHWCLQMDGINIITSIERQIEHLECQAANALAVQQLMAPLNDIVPPPFEFEPPQTIVIEPRVDLSSLSALTEDDDDDFIIPGGVMIPHNVKRKASLEDASDSSLATSSTHRAKPDKARRILTTIDRVYEAFIQHDIAALRTLIESLIGSRLPDRPQTPKRTSSSTNSLASYSSASTSVFFPTPSPTSVPTELENNVIKFFQLIHQESNLEEIQPVLQTSTHAFFMTLLLVLNKHPRLINQLAQNHHLDRVILYLPIQELALMISNLISPFRIHMCVDSTKSILQMLHNRAQAHPTEQARIALLISELYQKAFTYHQTKRNSKGLHQNACHTLETYAMLYNITDLPPTGPTMP